MSENRLSGGQILAIVAVAAGGYFARTEIKWNGWADFAALCAFMLLMVWLLWPSNRRDAESHEGAREGFAFRLGKSLKRIRGR